MKLLVGCGGSGEAPNDALALAALIGELLDADVVLGAVGSGVRLGHSMGRLKRLAPTVAIERRAIESSSPGAGLIDLAEREDVDMVVIGSTRRGSVGRLSLGTTADYLIAHATRPFAVAPRGYADRRDRELRIIGLAYDGSDEAKRAARVAAGLAVLSATGLRAFGVREPLGGWMAPGAEATSGDAVAHREPLEEELNQLLEDLPSSVGGQKVILAGDPATTLLDQGSRAADVMVFGTHGFGRFFRLTGGSVASEVVRNAPWPVLVVPPEGPLPFQGHPEAAVRRA